MDAAEILKCDVVKKISIFLTDAKNENLIRGHLWEHACIHLISNLYKVETGEKVLPNAIVKRVSFNRFSQDPISNFESETYLHYKKFLIAATAAASEK